MAGRVPVKAKQGAFQDRVYRCNSMSWDLCRRFWRLLPPLFLATFAPRALLDWPRLTRAAPHGLTSPHSPPPAPAVLLDGEKKEMAFRRTPTVYLYHESATADQYRTYALVRTCSVIRTLRQPVCKLHSAASRPEFRSLSITLLAAKGKVNKRATFDGKNTRARKMPLARWLWVLDDFAPGLLTPPPGLTQLRAASP
jgi:hypothetical protein